MIPAVWEPHAGRGNFCSFVIIGTKQVLSKEAAFELTDLNDINTQQFLRHVSVTL